MSMGMMGLGMEVVVGRRIPIRSDVGVFGDVCTLWIGI